MPRSFPKMPPLPDAIDDPKVKEFMSHYYAMSNDDTDHGGFADMFTRDGEYSMNARKAKGREGMYILFRYSPLALLLLPLLLPFDPVVPTHPSFLFPVPPLRTSYPSPSR